MNHCFDDALLWSASEPYSTETLLSAVLSYSLPPPPRARNQQSQTPESELRSGKVERLGNDDVPRRLRGGGGSFWGGSLQRQGFGEITSTRLGGCSSRGTE